ncbi:PREDICTED: coiled-coil domain-containing protein 18-like [Amphimedon queenslandica]|uniref:Uncharacterized protein n=1 Tax=Amphimedon queenslandica TaxID=400682 RepID=A0A1X7ULG8_AMPQE|nr:PREDICTED: coiled-coil domain-containing protein 18-like [Amphimedon queenslandica]|eukprot:XP_019853678.1 PREDICTED: coiled-coil domain-containing protein 18-like [Amphimedon queenslandica]
MPLKGKLFKGRKSKRDGDASSIASTQSQEVPVNGVGYTILKPDKELPFKLHRAVWNARTEKLMHLLEENSGKSGKPKHDPNAVDKKGRTALHLAAVKEDPALIDLLAATAVPSCRMQDSDGNTPLHKAVECKKYASAVKIIAMTENVNVRNNNGHTPLHLASLNNDVPMAHKLLDKGAYVDECDNNDNTPLSLSCIHSHKEFAELMVKEDCNVNIQNNKGLTPLMLAVMENQLSIVTCLLEAPQIDIDVKEFTGKRAIDYAQPNSSIFSVLNKKMASDDTASPTASHFPQQGTGTGGSFGASPIATVSTSAAPPTSNILDDLSRQDTFQSSDSDSSLIDAVGGGGGGIGSGLVGGREETSFNMDEAMKEKLRKTFLGDDDDDKEEKVTKNEETDIAVTVTVPAKDVKSDADKVPIHETPKLNVHETSALTSEEEEEEEEINGVIPKRREGEEGGGERMKDSPVKERPKPLLTAGATSVTDNSKQTSDNLKDTDSNAKDHITITDDIAHQSSHTEASQHVHKPPPSPAKPVERDNWDWDSSESEEEEEVEVEVEVEEKEVELHKVKEGEKEPEESSKWDSTTTDDDDLDENDLPSFDTNLTSFYNHQSFSTPLNTTPSTTRPLTSISSPLGLATATNATPSSVQTYTASTPHSASIGLIPTATVTGSGATGGIPSVQVLERTLKSQDSNIINDDSDYHVSSGGKLLPQTSTDFRLSMKNENELGGSEVIDTLGATPKKPSAVPAYRSEPTITSVLSGNTNMQSLIAERKKANQDNLEHVLTREEEASRRKKEKDSEILRMLEQRKKITDGDSVTSSPIKTTNTTEEKETGIKRNKAQLMKEKWESGALNISSSSSSSIPSTPTSPSPSHLPLSLPPPHPASKHEGRGGGGGTSDIIHTTPSRQTLDASVTASHSKVSPQKLLQSSGPSGLSSLNSPSSSSREGPNEDIQKKYEELHRQNLKLENEKLEKELEVRGLKYQLDQIKGDYQTVLDVRTNLKDQLSRAEDQMREKAEDTQSIALRMREIEMENKSLQAKCQQLEEELQVLKETLDTERQEYFSNAAAYEEQKRLYQELKGEADRAVEQQKTLSGLLDEVDNAKDNLGKEIVELKETNKKLETELIETKTQYELTQNQLEGQLEELREEVSEYREKDAVMKKNLTDLSGKVEVLTAALDKETNTRQRLEEQLSSASNEVSQLQLERAKGDKASLEASQELLREKLTLEKDLGTAKEEKQRLSIQFDNVQGKLIATEQELKSTVSVVSDKSNQISNLQRQVDQLTHYQQTAQESLIREKEKVSQLESQLASASEKLNTSLNETHRAGMKVEAAERKASETEETLKKEQVLLTDTVSSLKMELEKANNEIQYQLEQVLSLKEQLAGSETSRALVENELQRAQQDSNAKSEMISDLENRLQSSDSTLTEVKGQREELQAQLTVLQSTLLSREEDVKKSKEMLDEFREALEKAQKSIKDMAADRDRQMKKKNELEVKLVEAEGKATLFLSEMSTGAEYIKQLQLEIEQLNQSRSSLQELATKLRSEVVSLDSQLDNEKSYRSKAEQENTELKELWENEVKAKHKITEKFMLLEQECKDSGDLVDTEKQKLLRAVEQKGMIEMKMETLHERNAQLQRENGELKGQLKSHKKKQKEFDKLESTAHALRQELDHTQSSMQAEITMLQNQVRLYQEQLKNETESRQSIEMKSSSLLLELDSVQKCLSSVRHDLQDKDKELRKSERQMSQLKEELSEMENTVNRKMIPKTELETITRQMEEKSTEDFSKKMIEFNDLLEQQALNYQKQDSIRVMQENERREKQDQEISELKQKLNGMMSHYEKQHSEIERAFLEAQRYKSLYEQEAKRRDKLIAKLDRSREVAATSRQQLSFEKKQTKKLRNAGYNVLSQLGTTPKLPTSTPIRHTSEAPHSPPTEELLRSIHSELDQSLARHLESTPASYNRPNFDSAHGAKAESHLDSIRRNYRL